MNRKQALTEGTQALIAADVPDAALDAAYLLSHLSGISRLSLLMQQDAPVPDAQLSAYRDFIRRRAQGEPLQYILQEAHFMGHAFYVDQRVLIPRPDTETLCEAALLRLSKGMDVLDIGTGSGALSISMALGCEGCRVFAVDISQDVLDVAKKNAKHLCAKVSFFHGDLFPSGEAMYDVIVSNPPYIPAGDMATLQREVKREPTLALVGGSDGLDFYRRIVDALPLRLCRGGSLLFEVGDGQAADVSAMLRGTFEKVEILRDLAGLDRVVTGDRYAG